MNLSTTHIIADLPGLSRALRSGEIDLIRYIRDLQDVFETHEPQVRAFLPEDGRFVRLERQAEDLLRMFPEPEARPALFGIAVGVKDIFRVDGFPTRAGSQVPEDRMAGHEATCVTRLKAQGALILGKTVTAEFAYFAPGPTRNPRHLDHTPGGSSSGSAAAVSASMVPLALGTQTIGSILRPASFCGVVGFKPSRERISRAGVIPLSVSLDHIGFFTAKASSAEWVAPFLFGDWSSAGQTDGGLPILGIPEGPYLERVTPDGMSHFEETCRRLQDMGYELKQVAAMTDFEEIYRRHNLILAAEAAEVHSAWFDEFGDRYHPKTAELIQRGRSVSAEALAQARKGCLELRETMTSLMREQKLDLWITPATPGPAPLGLDNTGDPVMNLPWSHCGLPSLSLPSGLTSDGLPFGTQFVGGWYKDEALLGWAKLLERDLALDGGSQP